MSIAAAATVVAAVVTAAAGAALVRRVRRRRRERERWLSAPPPRFWREVLRRRFPLYNRLPGAVRERLHRHLKVFLAEKTFCACGGLPPVDDGKAVTIAGHACLLLAGRRDGECFPTVRSVLVYPDVFTGKARRAIAGGAEIVGDEARVGEASSLGSVVVSWREILQNNALAGNGRDVVMHEFAHHIRPEGAALLAELDAGYRRLCANPAGSVIDDYGAESRDEFWAVSVEAFFDDARRLRENEPAWYARLAEFFALDPARWTAPDAAARADGR